MASSSSSAAKPSTSASNEISQVDENTNQTQNPVTVSDDQNSKKNSCFPNPLKSKHREQKLPQPTKENVSNPEEEARTKADMEIDAIKKLIEADFHTIEKAVERITNNRNVFDGAKTKFGELTAPLNAKDIREFKNVVKTLKQQIFNQGKKQHDIQVEKRDLLKQLDKILTANTQVAKKEQLKMMPNLFADDSEFERTLQFKDFKARYDELPLELKLCLLCFSVFPENVEIKRRVLVYWWIGEGFVPSPTKLGSEETQEEWASKYFKMLLNKGFIESAEKKPNSKVDVVKMHPFVRLMVNRIAKKAEFFEFDGDGTVNVEFSKSLRACLVMDDKKAVDKEANDSLSKEKEANDRLKSIHAIFNVDEAILDSKHDSLSKMTNANVLYLGRWQSSGTHHIEVDDFKILDAKKGNLLDGLQHIKYLKFLSLQGISRITELPKSILKLHNLTILDIRACHNLEKIPNGIGCLKNLTHLDMSECYLLDEMPKGISKLKNLQVLSGFVVLESEGKKKKTCTLFDLKDFPHLRKLSIHTGSDKFPLEEHLKALNQFKKLSKLTIAWGRGSVNNSQREPGFDKSPTVNADKDNKEESQRSINTGEQGKDKVNPDKEQTLKKENSEILAKEAYMGNQDNDQTSKRENSGEVTKEADTSNKDNVQTSKNENSREVTNEANTSNQNNVQTSKNENSGEVTNEADTRNQNNVQTTKKENSGEITKEADVGNQHNDQTSKKENSGEITKEADTSNQDNVQTSKKETSREINKKADMGNHDNDQTLKKDNQERKKNGNALRNQDLEENNVSQEETCEKKIQELLKNQFSKRKTTTKDNGALAQLPSKLTKLDLQCLPKITHNWLRSGKLMNLEKLYIRGGKLSDLGQFHDLDDSSEKQTWGKVTELRLKYLDEVEMEWRELLELFPKLEYLEKVDCPKLSFFPCDEIGVWKKKNS